MEYTDIQIVLQEVPGEISICFFITGCSLRCPGCHSPYSWKNGHGQLLTKDIYKDILKKYERFASCVLFMGGEWHRKELVQFLHYARKNGYKTCLYTGEEEVDDEILNELTWIKTGRWIQELGGLDNEKTNQEFIELKSNRILNELFINQ